MTCNGKVARRCEICGEIMTQVVRSDGHGHKQRSWTCMNNSCKNGECNDPWAALLEDEAGGSMPEEGGPIVKPK